MKNLKHTQRGILLCAFLAMAGLTRMFAQTPSDAVMMDPGQICIGAFYEYNSWDQYWEGTLLRNNGNLGTVKTSVYSGGIDLGLIKRLNLLVSLPYIVTNNTANTITGSKGIQDISVFLKVDAWDKKLGPGTLHLLATGGYSHPCSNYFPTEPFAIGLGCPEGNLRGIVHYNLDMGLYLRGTAAFHLRGETPIDQIYYYTTQSYYAEEVDMPNAWDYTGTLGYLTKDQTFKAELVYNLFNTTGGFDIRRQDGGFPSNERDFSTMGVNLAYYSLFWKGTGIYLNGSYTLTGRNVGKALFFGGGLSYQFNIWNRTKGDTSSESK